MKADALDGGFQVAESAEADFEKNTWTFNMSGNYRVSAGYFALVPIHDFSEIRAKLARAEGLLREGMYKPLDIDAWRDRVAAFFDPDPL